MAGPRSGGRDEDGECLVPAVQRLDQVSAGLSTEAVRLRFEHRGQLIRRDVPLFECVSDDTREVVDVDVVGDVSDRPTNRRDWQAVEDHHVGWVQLSVPDPQVVLGGPSSHTGGEVDRRRQDVTESVEACSRVPGYGKKAVSVRGCGEGQPGAAEILQRAVVGLRQCVHAAAYPVDDLLFDEPVEPVSRDAGDRRLRGGEETPLGRAEPQQGGERVS